MCYHRMVATEETHLYNPLKKKKGVVLQAVTLYLTYSTNYHSAFVG